MEEMPKPLDSKDKNLKEIEKEFMDLLNDLKS